VRSPRRRVAFVNHLPLGLPRGDRPARNSSLSIWHLEIAKRLAREFDVVVYSPGGGGGGIEAERFGGVDFIAVPTRSDDRLARWLGRVRRLPGLSPSPRRPLFASRIFQRGFARRVADDVRRREGQLVTVANFSQFVGAVKARNPGIRAGLHMHCEWLTQLDPRIVEPRLRDCDLIGGCSRFISGGVARKFPEVADRCFALPNGVDLEAFRPGPEGAEAGRDPQVLFVGRLSPEKGVHDLLSAFPRVAERVPGVRLTLVGGRVPAPFEYVVPLSDDPLVRDLAKYYAGGRDAYEAHLRRSIPATLVDRVEFRDEVPQGELPEMYRASDVFVFPSAWNEPFGMPVAEAMACGVPVVATRGGGIPEFVDHGTSGLLVERANPQALGEAIATLLEDPEKRARLGRAGRERVARELNWDEVADRLGAKLEESLARPPAVSRVPP